MPSLPPRQSVTALQPVCATPCCLRPTETDSASGSNVFSRLPVRSLSLRPGNSPTTLYGGRVNGVGSRTGAPTVGSGGNSNHFRVGPQSGSPGHVSSPRLVKRSMRISRTTLSCLLRVKGYVAVRVGSAFRAAHSSRFLLHLFQPFSAFAFTYILCLRSRSLIGAFIISPLPPMLPKSLQTAGSLPSTGVTRLHRYYQPLRHPLACQPTSRCSRLYGLPCSADFSPGRGGLLQLLSASSLPCRRYHPAGVPQRLSQSALRHAAFVL